MHLLLSVEEVLDALTKVVVDLFFDELLAQLLLLNLTEYLLNFVIIINN